MNQFVRHVALSGSSLSVMMLAGEPYRPDPARYVLNTPTGPKVIINRRVMPNGDALFVLADGSRVRVRANGAILPPKFAGVAAEAS